MPSVCDHKTYDKKVTIQRLAGTADAHGFVPQTTSANWSEYAQAWCRVTSTGGREFWKVQQVNADVSHVWRCMWSKTLADATPDMRLIHEGTVYNILSVVDIDLAHREIEIQTARRMQ